MPLSRPALTTAVLVMASPRAVRTADGRAALADARPVVRLALERTPDTDRTDLDGTGVPADRVRVP